MGRIPTIPKPTLERLFLYYRILETCQEAGKDVISSDELGKRAGVDAAQVRKDLTFSAECGRPGIGYSVADLADSLQSLLGLKTVTVAALVGVGKLGTAIHNYSGFTRFGLRIGALFDVDPAVAGQRLGDHEVLSLDKLAETLQEHHIQMAIIAVPAASAQSTADALVTAGVRAIWNFAPVTLRVPPGVIVRNEDLAVGLASLSWYLARATHTL